MVIKDKLKEEIELTFKRWWIGDDTLSQLEEMILQTIERVYSEEEVAE